MSNNYEFKAPVELMSLVPLYIASQIYKEDDIGLSTIYRNEFEVGREQLKNSSSNSKAGSGKIVNLGGIM